MTEKTTLIVCCVVGGIILLFNLLLMFKMWRACNNIARLTDAYAPKLKKDLAIPEYLYYKSLYEARLQEANKDQEASEINNDTPNEK